MGISDFFKKKGSAKEGDDSGKEGASKNDLSQAMENVDTSKLSMKEKMGLKMFQKMSPEKQEAMMRQALNPQEVMKHKEKILAQVDQMVKSGQIDKGQAAAVKSKMGLR